ncbi:hypothetical protein GVN21_16775 [Caulobacter sp. SLTY]|uniref:hypothetical protein n=1 Tax=Caulobacter sp. SLTY TaxID=2683262 RepID=UPI00141257BC|nr:hypothetical protein [Caulobacter sp. SLTY]NBB17022.1 hypothetical protein [Caulobacter sp. SLTY]
MLNFTRLRLWIIIPLLALAGFALALAAATGFLWDRKIEAISFGSAAQWAAAAVNIIVVAVTLHLADKGRRDAVAATEGEKAKVTADLNALLATAAFQIFQFRRDAGPKGENLPEIAEGFADWLTTVRELLEIAARRGDISPGEALHVLAMRILVSRAIRYIRDGFGGLDPAESLDMLVDNARKYCRLTYAMHEPEEFEAELARDAETKAN